MGNLRYTTEEIIQKFIDMGRTEDEWDYSEVVYKGFKDYITVTHKVCGYRFDITVQGFINSIKHCPFGCIRCASKHLKEVPHTWVAERKKNFNDLMESMKERGLTDYDIKESDFVDYKTHIKFKCNLCGKEFNRKAGAIVGWKGCPCRFPKKESKPNKNMKTTEQFIQESLDKGLTKWDYSLVNYTGCDNLIELICKDCGYYVHRKPREHLAFGYGCRSCNGGLKKTTEIFIKELREIFGDKFDYNSINYTSLNAFYTLKCNDCGNESTKRGDVWLTGDSCKYCRRDTKEIFIQKADKRFESDAFDYSQVEYKGSKVKVKIICKTCGSELYRTPKSTTHGHE